jgi:hypothetical protein
MESEVPRSLYACNWRISVGILEFIIDEKSFVDDSN